ncbi:MULTISPECIES: hypothetical protein [Pedobacter]|uniref:Uncharacterized protein n=1 Tax=Pedobacter montanisoli TaxID=2923277 RepID=A0ABS9ZZ37_9SPHI|nr:hypothetical protein [Pedobacter montanisoli]MCJ0743573.1 hypothetical protein [Pedobacter montanisoli]
MLSELIEKEEIHVDRIIPADITLSDDIIQKLKVVERLGNEFKGKAKITFNTIDGPKKVITTVWSVTEKYLQLKNNVHIPIKSIIDIDF